MVRPSALAVLRLITSSSELCGRLGDEADQAAWWAGILMTSMPFWNLIPAMTFGNWFSPFNRRHVFAAASTSLKTMSLAVFADRAPFVRTVRWRIVANTLSIGLDVRRWSQCSAGKSKKASKSFPVLRQTSDRLLVLGSEFVGEHGDRRLGRC